jgi:hypothetical protein
MCTSSLLRDRSNPAYNITGPPGAGCFDNPQVVTGEAPLHDIP